jgi:hypothetical protein
MEQLDKPRIRVDFNELVQPALVLLAKTDNVQDSAGNQVILEEGLFLSIYEFNHYDDGTNEYLFADGTVELNNPDMNGKWSSAAKWCCRINKNGITDLVT